MSVIFGPVEPPSRTFSVPVGRGAHLFRCRAAMSNEDKVSNTIEELAGKSKETAGRATDKPPSSRARTA
jgi:hypothetical protein